MQLRTAVKELTLPGGRVLAEWCEDDTGECCADETGGDMPECGAFGQLPRTFYVTLAGMSGANVGPYWNIGADALAGFTADRCWHDATTPSGITLGLMSQANAWENKSYRMKFVGTGTDFYGNLATPLYILADSKPTLATWHRDSGDVRTDGTVQPIADRFDLAASVIASMPTSLFPFRCPEAVDVVNWATPVCDYLNYDVPCVGAGGVPLVSPSPFAFNPGCDFDVVSGCRYRLISANKSAANAYSGGWLGPASGANCVYHPAQWGFLPDGTASPILVQYRSVVEVHRQIVAAVYCDCDAGPRVELNFYTVIVSRGHYKTTETNAYVDAPVSGVRVESHWYGNVIRSKQTGVAPDVYHHGWRACFGTGDPATYSPMPTVLLSRDGSGAIAGQAVQRDEVTLPADGTIGDILISA